MNSNKKKISKHIDIFTEQKMQNLLGVKLHIYTYIVN
jgi:hypothetical protein